MYNKSDYNLWTISFRSIYSNNVTAVFDIYARRNSTETFFILTPTSSISAYVSQFFPQLYITYCGKFVDFLKFLLEYNSIRDLKTTKNKNLTTEILLKHKKKTKFQLLNVILSNELSHQPSLGLQWIFYACSSLR